MKFKFYKKVRYEIFLNQGCWEIDTKEYPELEGMSKKEALKYIENNCDDMKPIDNNYSCLWDELLQKEDNMEWFNWLDPKNLKSEEGYLVLDPKSEDYEFHIYYR